jgi:hypothetical protein
MTKAQTVAVIDDAIAFTKAAGRSCLSESDFRRACAALGALPAEQVTRICVYAREQQLAAEARVRRHTTRRGR